MEKLVKCHYWKEYQGLNGWTMFCSAGAFAKKFTKSFAEGLGCTAEQRTLCQKIMEENLGYGLLPQIEVEAEKTAPKKITATSIP